MTDVVGRSDKVSIIDYGSIKLQAKIGGEGRVTDYKAVLNNKTTVAVRKCLFDKLDANTIKDCIAEVDSAR